MNMDDRRETFEQFRERIERDRKQRAMARAAEEARICHHLAPLVGVLAAIYGFATEHSITNRLSMAAIYFAWGWATIWGTVLVRRMLRLTTFAAKQEQWLRAEYWSKAGREEEHKPDPNARAATPLIHRYLGSHVACRAVFSTTS
jgi:hypothetical protein